MRRWWWDRVSTPIWWWWNRPWASQPLLGHTSYDAKPYIRGQRATLVIIDDPVR